MNFTFCMKLHFQLIIFLVLAISLYSCQNNKQETEKAKTDYREADQKIEDLNHRAASDTTFRKSEEYRNKMETACIEKAKMAHSLHSVDKVLLDYETSVHILKTYNDKLKANDKLYKNKQFMEMVEAQTSKVRDCYRILQKAELSTEQKAKFDALTLSHK